VSGTAGADKAQKEVGNVSGEERLFVLLKTHGTGSKKGTV
jgi:hypothetical protein